MNYWARTLFVVMMISLQTLSVAQTATAPAVLAGTWQRVSSKDPYGRNLQPPAPAAVLVFTADGRFTQIAIPAKRHKYDKPVSALTREELLEHFGHLEAFQGTYEVKGDVLTRRSIGHVNPALEGRTIKQMLRFDGDTLVLTMAPPAQPFVARFKRVVH